MDRTPLVINPKKKKKKTGSLRRTKSMDYYERIQKPSNLQQQGGFSPSKLRAILLGIDKKRKEEEELESGFGLRSEAGEIEDRGGNDVDMVSSLPECSKSVDFVSGYRSNDQHLANAKVRSQEGDHVDSESVSSSAFEFHKPTERASHRPLPFLPPFSKPSPSKWDDAEKWIASPISNRTSKGGSGGLQPKKSSLGGYGNRSFGAKVVLEVTDEVDTKRVDSSQAKKDIGEQKALNWVAEPFRTLGLGDKTSTVFENPFADSSISLSKHDSSTSVQSATAYIASPSTVKSISMRDMGTEMTPIASQEASRTGTPNSSVTPMRSPTSSRPLSPARIGPNSNVNESAEHVNQKELSEKELKLKTRKEIMVLGQQLGKMSIAAWASKEEEESDATVPVEQLAKSVNEARAAAWEDAEKAKYLARFKQEEIKIQAWENHQKAKTEAEMRKIEVEVERMKARAHEKLMNQLAAARHKAEEKRAAAEAKRNQQAAKTMQQAEYIRRTGRIPSSSFWRGWCS